MGDHVQADHLVRQGGLLAVQPYSGQSGDRHPQQQGQFPPAQLSILFSLHKNTVHYVVLQQLHCGRHFCFLYRNHSTGSNPCAKKVSR